MKKVVLTFLGLFALVKGVHSNSFTIFSPYLKMLEGKSLLLIQEDLLLGIGFNDNDFTEHKTLSRKCCEDEKLSEEYLCLLNPDRFLKENLTLQVGANKTTINLLPQTYSIFTYSVN